MNQIIGLKFPVQFHGGRLSLSTGVQHIKESILQIIGTGKLEYLLKPDFGSDLNRRVFDPVNVAALVKRDVNHAVRRYEPRVELRDVRVDMSQSSIGIVNIIIDFHIKELGINSSVSATI